MTGVVAASNNVPKATVTGRYVPSQKGTQLVSEEIEGGHFGQVRRLRGVILAK